MNLTSMYEWSVITLMVECLSVCSGSETKKHKWDDFKQQKKELKQNRQQTDLLNSEQCQAGVGDGQEVG